MPRMPQHSIAGCLECQGLTTAGENFCMRQGAGGMFYAITDVLARSWFRVREFMKLLLTAMPAYSGIRNASSLSGPADAGLKKRSAQGSR